VTRVKRPHQVAARELAVYFGTMALGVIRVRGDGKAIAFADDGETLGIFDNYRRAAKAISAAAPKLRRPITPPALASPPTGAVT